MVLTYLECVVDACRRKGFDAKRLAGQLLKLPEISGDLASNLFGRGFFDLVDASIHWEDALQKFCNEWINVHQNKTIVCVAIAASEIGNYELVSVIKTELDNINLDKLSSREREALATLTNELLQIDGRAFKNNPVYWKVRRFGRTWRLDHSFERPDDEGPLRAAIQEMCQTMQGSILIFGEGGIGKTALVSESIYFNDPFLQSLSIGTVFWLNVYEFSQLENDCGPLAMFDELAGLMKVENGQNVSSLRVSTHLQSISGPTNKCLIIFDDVFSEEIFSAARRLLCDHVYLLAISRNRNVFGFNTPTSDFKISPLKDDFLVGIFSNLKAKFNFSDVKMTKLIELCSGLPLLVKVILAKFASCQHSKEAEVVLEKLLKCFPEKFINSKWDEEKKKETIYDLLLVGFEETHKLRMRYSGFLFFPQGSVVDIDDLAVLWQCSSMEAIDVAMKFRDHSLVRTNWSEERLSLNIHAYLYAASMKLATSRVAESPLRLRERLLQETALSSYENALHIAIRDRRLVLFDAILAVLLNTECDVNVIFDICSKATPLKNLLNVEGWPPCEEWQVYTRSAVPIVCQILERMFVFDSKRTVKLIKGSLLRSLLNTVRDGFKWYRNALLTSAANGHQTLSEFLLREGADINTVDDFGCNVLIKAAETNLNATIGTFLTHEATVNVNAANNQGETALIVASKLGFFDTASALLASKKCEVRVSDKNGDTALHHAARGARTAIVEVLLKSLDLKTINSVDGNGDSPLWLAKLLENQRSCELLTKAGAKLSEEEIEFFEIRKRLQLRLEHKRAKDINKALLRYLFGNASIITSDEIRKFLTSAYNGKIPKHTEIGKDAFEKAFLISAFIGHSGVLKAVLAGKMVNLETSGKDEATALIIASRYGHREIVALLLENHAEVEACDKDGWTALMIASRYGHFEVVALLVENGGAKLETRNKDAWSALMIACHYGHCKVASLLIEKNADLEARNKDGWASLMSASQAGHFEIVKLLVEHRADVQARNRNGSSPLMFASQNGHFNVAAFLVENGADVGARNKIGMSPLMIASQNGHRDVVKFLVDNRAAVEARTKDGWTPLMVACQNGHREVVSLLIENNADLEVRNKDGFSPLMIASQNGHNNIVELLEISNLERWCMANSAPPKRKTVAKR